MVTFCSVAFVNMLCRIQTNQLDIHTEKLRRFSALKAHCSVSGPTLYCTRNSSAKHGTLDGKKSCPVVVAGGLVERHCHCGSIGAAPPETRLAVTEQIVEGGRVGIVREWNTPGTALRNHSRTSNVMRVITIIVIVILIKSRLRENSNHRRRRILGNPLSMTRSLP
jgi:hypothetical protein